MKKTFTKLTFMMLGMLLFSFSSTAQDLECVITLPSGEISVPVGAPADDFGGVLGSGESISGIAVATVSDVTADPPADDTPDMGCDTIINGAEVMGNVALVQRGACFFSDKVYRAQVAGAISAIICNHTPGAGVIGMASGGDFGGLAEIPSGFVSFEDCALITAAIENGDEVTITLRKANLFSGVSAFAKQTPQSQILSLDSMAVSFSNAGDTIITDSEFKVDITDPSGVVTSLTSVGEIPAASNVTAGFDPYLPDEVGRYFLAFSSNVTSDTIFDFFDITEHTWALDDDSFASTAGISDQGFIDNGYRYDMGSYYLTGPAGALVTHAGFALGNAADVTSGNPDNDFFTLLLYNVGDAVTGASDSYEDFDLVTFGFISIDGTEAQDEMIIAQFDDVIELDANEDYMLVVSYSGQDADLGISPRYTTGGSTPYPLFGTTVFTDRLFMGGFTGGPNGAVRLYEEGAFVATNELFLDASQVQLSPNPVSTDLTVSFDLKAQADEVRIDIINLQGQVVMTQTLENVLNSDYQININKLPEGSYVLTTITPEGRSASQFIVTK